MVSPILGAPIDYSLFTPRGHYTRTPQLTRFFLGMSTLEQLSFCLPGTFKCPGIEPARIGILASRALVQDPDLVSLWRQIYEPTAFLVGAADDYTPLDVQKAAESTPAGGLDNAQAFASDAAVNAIVRALVKARPVKINPERAAIRLMGTRFVLDSYLLDQLVFPNVGTGDKPRLTPSALDLAAAFGSSYAEQLLEQEGAYRLRQLRKPAREGAKGGIDPPGQRTGARPSTTPGCTRSNRCSCATERPSRTSCATRPGRRRRCSRASAPITELKHDTILFSKQLIAEGGGENPAPAGEKLGRARPGRLRAPRRGRQADAARADGTRICSTKQAGGLLASEIGMFGFFERIATDELAGKPISTKDNERLHNISGEFEAIWWRTADVSQYAEPNDADDEALVADIGSSPKGVLELGTGRIDRILVLVPDDQGNFQLASGGVYSYYEFLEPPGQRLTDKEWQAILNSGKAPARPSWEKVFLPG